MKLITKDTEAVAVSVLTTAFMNDPFKAWLSSRPDFSRTVMEIMVPVFRRGGLAYLTDEEDAAALWVRPDRALRVPRSPAARWRLFRAGGLKGLLRLDRLFHSAGAVHPDEPHYYLFLLGRLPGEEHRGAGSRVLDPFLEKADREDVAVYLETSNEKNLPYYERRGFRLTGARKADRHGPAAWFMWRDRPSAPETKPASDPTS